MPRSCAEADKQTAILKAEADKEAVIREARTKEQKMRIAVGEAQAIELGTEGTGRQSGQAERGKTPASLF